MGESQSSQASPESQESKTESQTSEIKGNEVDQPEENKKTETVITVSYKMTNAFL